MLKISLYQRICLKTVSKPKLMSRNVPILLLIITRKNIQKTHLNYTLFRNCLPPFLVQALTRFLMAVTVTFKVSFSLFLSNYLKFSSSVLVPSSQGFSELSCIYIHGETGKTCLCILIQKYSSSNHIMLQIGKCKT